MKIGVRVYCYYDTEIPILKGVTIPNDSTVPYDLAQNVHWDDGGSSYFPLDRIFTDYNVANRYYQEKLKEVAKQVEENEYQLYLSLKEKYEGANNNED